jgi:hypothetical protein
MSESSSGSFAWDVVWNLIRHCGREPQCSRVFSDGPVTWKFDVPDERWLLVLRDPRDEFPEFDFALIDLKQGGKAYEVTLYGADSLERYTVVIDNCNFPSQYPATLEFFRMTAKDVSDWIWRDTSRTPGVEYGNDD